MKNFTIFFSVLISLLISKSTYGQKATAEYITSISPPSIEKNIPVKDGDRYVTFHNGYLFIVNFWAGVQIYDVSVVSQPKKIAFIKTEDMVHHIAFAGERMFIANEEEGVLIYDISNIANPSKIGEIKTPGDAYWLVMQPPYMYVALGSSGFAIMDISDFNHPKTVTMEIPDTWVWSLNLVGNRLYAAAKQGGVLIYDVSSPENVKKINQYKTGYQALQLQIEGNIAFIADGPGGLSIMDFSDLQLPREIARFPSKGFTQHVFKSGNYAYLSNRDLGLLIVNISDISNPYLEAQYIPESETFASYKKDVYVFLATDNQTEILRHNNQPVLQPLDDIVIKENTNFVLQLKARDPDGDSLVFEAENLPPGSQFDSQTGLFRWQPTYEQSGIYPNLIFSAVEITGSKLRDSDTVDVTVNHVNRNPDIPPVENLSVPEDSLLTITIAEGSDPDKEDAGKLSYRAENMPEGAKFDTLNRVFTWRPTFEQSGSYVVDFVVEDAMGGIDRESTTITVTHVDRPPKITTIEDKVIDEDSTLAIPLKGEEPDKEDVNKMHYEVLNLPKGATFDPATATIHWTPGFDQSGTYNNITAILHAGALSDSTHFNITVNHVNRPPVLAEIGDKTVDENQTLTFQINGTDPDVEDTGKLVFTTDSLPVGAAFDPGSLTFNWTPTYEQSGNYKIIFRVSDPAGLTDQKMVAITVNHVNRAPSLAEIPAFDIKENEPLNYQLSANDPDREDANNLRYSVNGLPDNATMDAETGQFSWTPGYDQSGSYSAVFGVTDGILSDSQTVAIQVAHVNRPPVIAEITDQTVDENQPLTFQVDASDPDVEDQGKVVVTAENLPEGATFDPQTKTFSWTPTFEQSGLYTNIRFTATDGEGLTYEESVSINVNHVNRPPQLASVSPITVDEMHPVDFTLQGSDPDREDAGLLKYQISDLPEGATIDAATGEFNWTPNYDQSGQYELTAMVTDPAGLGTQTAIPVTVNNVNRPPQIEPLPPVAGKENQPVNLTLNYQDPDREDAGKLQVTASNLPQGASLDANNGVISWTPNYNQDGSYDIQYKITDASGASAEGSVSLQIDNVNRPPKLNGIGNKSVKEGESLIFTVGADDPDQEDQDNLIYSLNKTPDGATFNSSNGTFSWSPNHNQQGEYKLTFEVTDSNGASDEKTITVTVEDVSQSGEIQPND